MTLPIILLLGLTAALSFAVAWAIKGAVDAESAGEAFSRGFREGVISRGGRLENISDWRAGRDA